MPDVPKNVAATASTLSIPVARSEKADKEQDLVRRAQAGEEAADGHVRVDQVGFFLPEQPNQGVKGAPMRHR